MTDREKLIDIIVRTPCVAVSSEYAAEHVIDHLLANGVTFKPAIPGPSNADPNIMELCFRNGERHMKEKMLAKLEELLEGMDYHKAMFIFKCLEDI